LHIGTPKTGSTSLQRCIEVNRSQIADSVRSQAGQVSLLATSEYFWFLHSEFHFLRLKQLFDSADLTLKRVIVYFRHQADLLSSALSTMVRDGFVAKNKP
jgi:hypothetical protein